MFCCCSKQRLLVGLTKHRDGLWLWLLEGFSALCPGCVRPAPELAPTRSGRVSAFQLARDFRTRWDVHSKLDLKILSKVIKL